VTPAVSVIGKPVHVARGLDIANVEPPTAADPVVATEAA